jgi:NADPH2:quinone reductase
MARAVQFDSYGDVDVLHIAQVPVPTPATGEVVVAVRAAGINPGEAAIRQGLFDAGSGAVPSGQGSDLAGVISAVGAEVTGFAVGDEVLGWSWRRSSQADYVQVPADQLVAKPAELSWEAAGSLYVVGATAWAAVTAVDPQPGETVVVSGAAGGVGTLVVQLLKLRGASVIGIASPANHAWLESHGVVPVAYGDDLPAKIREAAGGAVDAFIDLYGPEYLRLAVDLGVPRDRIETIISFAAAQELGTKADGSTEGTSVEVLAEVAELVATGQVELPIAAGYPLDAVQEAYTELEKRHTRGKIVLIP